MPKHGLDELPTACFQNHIDKKSNLVLQAYFNKASESADMAEPGHTTTWIRKHVGYFPHYKALLSLEHGLASGSIRSKRPAATMRDDTSSLKQHCINSEGQTYLIR